MAEIEGTILKHYREGSVRNGAGTNYDKIVVKTQAGEITTWIDSVAVQGLDCKGDNIAIVKGYLLVKLGTLMDKEGTPLLGRQHVLESPEFG